MVSPDNLPLQPAMLFGSGGFARDLINKYHGKISGMLESEARIERGDLPNLGYPWLSPDNAVGNILLGTSVSAYQLEQLQLLAASGADNIEQIWIADPYLNERKLANIESEKRILLIEHGAGIKRHWQHLIQFRQYFNQRGYTVSSLCPLMLYSSDAYRFAAATFIWGGQRDIYRIADPLLQGINPTYIEYGFFPQSQHYYLDKKGVNQHCSLMDDDLSWVDEQHLGKLEQVKSGFLQGYRHQSADYVLVPLQVPDDANIINCCRFTNGMQEFIDYIVNYYPTSQKIMFKAHPKDPKQHTYNYRGKHHSDEPFLVLLQHAKHVHGITSSTLYEAALAGVDIITEGLSLLSRHQNNLTKLFAAMVDRQVPVSENNLKYWLDRYSFSRVNG